MSGPVALAALAASIVLMAGAQLLLKARLNVLGHQRAESVGGLWRTLLDGLGDPLIWAAGLVIGVAAACWYSAMLRLPISLMLPLAGLIAPIVSIGAWLLLGESLSAAKIAAILLIAGGAAWLGWLSA